MKRTEIEVGKFYIAEISGNQTIVKVTDSCQTGGWYAVIIKTNRQVILRSPSCIKREATNGEMRSKKIGVQLIKFEIPDGQRIEGFDELVKKLMDGATIPQSEPASWVSRNFRVDQSVQLRLAKVIIELTAGKTASDLWSETTMSRDLCEEIIEIRDKLIDLLE